MADFLKSFNRCLEWEGWEVELVPGDKGGYTCCGITQAYNPQWIGFEILKKNGGKIDDEVKKAVMSFYMAEYNKLRLAELESQAIADQIYQAYINVGNKAVRWAQEIAGVTPDGVIGTMSIHALNDYDEWMFTNKYADRQCAFYSAIVKNDPTQGKFIIGWHKRANSFRVV